MRTLTCTVTLAAFLVVGAAAYGGFYNPLAIGTVIPAPATAHLTCYDLDDGFRFAGANTTRADILATFVQQVATPSGYRDSKVCFLRPPMLNGGEWTEQPPVRIDPSPVPAANCPNGFVAVSGGCVPPDHPLAGR